MEIHFDGVSRGAVAAARQTRTGIHDVGGAAKATERELGKLTRGTLAGSGAFHHLGRSIAFASGSFLGAAGFVEVVKHSIELASDMQQMIGRVDAVFGRNAKQVEAWSGTLAKSLGLSRDQALSSAVRISNLTQAMGLSRPASTRMAEGLTELAAKMALFANTSPEAATKALTSALAGRARALRQYGIVIDDTTVKAEAMRLGLIKTSVDSRKVQEAQLALNIALAQAAAAHKKYGDNTTQAASADLRVQRAHDALKRATSGVSGEMSKAAKAQATYSLIQGQTGRVQDAFRRNQHSLAQQSRVLHAELTNVEEEIGTRLIPVVLRIVQPMADWLGHTRNQKRLQDDLNTVIKTATGVVQSLFGVVRTMKPGFDAFAKAVGGTKNAFVLLFALGIVAKLRALQIALGLTAATGVAGAAGTAAAEVGALRLALATLFSTSVLTGLGRLVAAIGGVGIAVAAVVASIPNASGGPPKTTTTVGKKEVFDWLSSGKASRNKAFLTFLNAYLKTHPGLDSSLTVTQLWNTDAAFRAAVIAWYNDHVRSTTTPIGPERGIGPGRRNEPSSGGLQLPTSFTPTHDTAGIPGYQPSVDIATKVGQRILAPENGQLTRRHFLPYKPGFGGWTCYFHGIQTGNVYFITHLGSCGAEGFYRRGQAIGTGGRAVGGMQHVHVGIVSTGGRTAPPTPTPTPTSPGSPLTVGTTATAPKGATEATIIGVKAGIDASLRALANLKPAVKAQLSELAEIAARHLRQLRAHLHVGMSAADLARTRVSIQKWGKVLAEEIKKARDKAQKEADYAAAVIARAFERRMEHVSRAVFKQFDAQTDAYHRAFDKTTNDTLNAMRKAFERQMSDFDKETERGLARLAAPAETGAEAALRQFREARQAEEDARAMQEAIASGDPEQVRQLQLQLQERYLEQQAEASRRAADDQATAAQEAYRAQRDDLKDAMQEREQALEDAYTTQREAEMRAWDDRREEQRIKLQEDMDDWMFWLENKKRTWVEFLKFLAARGWDVPPSWLEGDEKTRFFDLWDAIQNPKRLRIKPPGLQAGGTIRAPRYVSRGDVIPAMLSHGETVIDRSLTEALERMVAGGRGGGDLHLHVTALGTTSREVWQGVARGVNPELKRRVGFERM